MPDLPPTEMLSSVATQLMTAKSVDVDGKATPVVRIGAGRLRTVPFQYESRRYQAIEQNPNKPSNWGKLARGGHRVVQFKDVSRNRFVAVAVDGQVFVYGSKRRA
jgi:hypothetical protein